MDRHSELDNPTEATLDSEAGDGLGDTSIFQEPDGHYQTPKPPSSVEYTLLSGDRLQLRLVGQSPLWGHLLWNAGQAISEYLQQDLAGLIAGKDILELGAGSGLPSLVCALLGARKVVITDYPDEDLIENLKYNIEHCVPIQRTGVDILAEGYLWGAPISSNLSLGFDVVILADLLFNHSEHNKLLSTVRKTLRCTSGARALVFFTPYRPWLLEKDMAFFDLAKQEGWIVEKVLEKVMKKVMFAEDRGEELLRRTVFGYQLRWQDVQ